MALGVASWSALRRRLTALLNAEEASSETRDRVARLLIPLNDAAMQLPAAIGDYSDFYASIHHATRVGEMFLTRTIRCCPTINMFRLVITAARRLLSSVVTDDQQALRPNQARGWRACLQRDQGIGL